MNEHNEDFEHMNIEYKFDSDGIWFTSDTHFSHANIIRFCNRPFRDVDEMNEELIRRWNATVPEDGTVFHLGDFCHGGSRDWNSIMYRLHGRIYLILGNHDMKSIRQGYTGRFAGVGADDVGDFLNSLWHASRRRPQLLRALSHVSFSRWGRHACGSPVWNDVGDMDESFEELPGWYQVFGHSQQEKDPVIREHFACLDCRRAFRLNEEGSIVEYL